MFKEPCPLVKGRLDQVGRLSAWIVKFVEEVGGEETGRKKKGGRRSFTTPLWRR